MSLRTGYHWTRRLWRPSRQQRRVLDALLDGKTNPEIAELLGISLDGAKWHVSHLFEKTDCETRQELAQWWREHRERYERSSGIGWFFGLGLRGVGAVAVAVAVVAIGTLTLLGVGHGGGSDKAALASATKQTSVLIGTATRPPTPTPQAPPFTPGAWVLDVQSGSATPLEGNYFSRLWLDPAAMTFVSFLDAVKIDHDGKQTSLIANSSNEVAFAYPDQATGNVVVWLPQSGLLKQIDAAGKEIKRHDFGRESPPGRAWDISTRTGRIAFTDSSGGGRTRIMTSDLDGAEQRELYRAQDGIAITSFLWSPDGGRLLVRLGPPSLQSDRFVVIDAKSGRVLIDQPGSALWAGSGYVLASTAGQRPMTGGGSGGSSYIDVATGAQTPAGNTDRLFCVSPDSRYGVFYDDLGLGGNGQIAKMDVQVKDLASGAGATEARVARNMLSCDWTWDGSRVVLSPAGR